MATAELTAALPELRRALAGAGTAVLSAPPGAGKTTSVPLALADEPWLRGQRIVMLEPRRLAARAAARRMASMLDEAVGQTVGYRVRFDSRISARTRVEVVTEGTLTRRLQRDPELGGIGLVIFDELHERHVQTDLALALTLDVRAVLRPDLRVLAMSATLATARVAQLLGGAPRIEVEGQPFPVATHFVGGGLDALSATIGRALAESGGDILVFLPGAREIRAAARQLAQRADVQQANLSICPLLGEMDSAAQDRALTPDAAGKRKIVLATNIAETSLTIEGVSTVVDSGLARVPRFDPNAALSRLDTVRISQAAAEQRRGRAARLGPGTCYRLWTESEHAARPRFEPAAILAADLMPVVLEVAAWGVTDPGSLAFLDPLPSGALAQATDALRELGAIDCARRITPAGRKMAEFPLHPRLAAMLTAAASETELALSCRLAAVIEEDSPWRGPLETRPIDIGSAVSLLAHPDSAPRSAFVRTGAVARARKAERALRRIAGAAVACPRASSESCGRLVLHAFPDRVARPAGEHGRFVMSNGRAVLVASTDPLAAAAWLVVVDAADRARGARAFLAALTNETDIRTILASRLRTDEVVRWDARSGAVLAERNVMLGRIALSSSRIAAPPAAAVGAAMLDGVHQLGLGALPWSDATRAWQARVELLRVLGGSGDDWPCVSDEALRDTMAVWLAPYLSRCTRREHLDDVPLGAALATLLPWPLPARLTDGAPEQILVPSGRSVRLRYQADGPPVLAVALQEMFGATQTPTIAWGRVDVQIHLLSPAGRPLQVTQDLSAFWANGYAEVRKEMRGRYPKHHWPDDPLAARPRAGARRRSR